jgi:hypothetical protein
MASLNEQFYPRPYITSSPLICPRATNVKSETATFSDDIAIFVPDGNPHIVCTALQGHLVALSTYFEQWKIKINAFKTQAIYFTRCWAPRKFPSANISIGGHPISWSMEVKYLGVTLDPSYPSYPRP